MSLAAAADAVTAHPAPLVLHPFRRTPGADASEIVRSHADVIGFGTHIAATLGWAVQVGHHAPLPGRGKTARLWELLATTSMLDVGAARILQPHLDALAVLAQARGDGVDVDPALARVAAGGDASWGVYAAESTDDHLEAVRAADGSWRLRGVKPWCSLAQDVTHALVTASTAGGGRALLAVAMRDRDHVRPRRGPWAARGLSQVVSAPVDFDDAPAVLIAGDDWYVERPGFAWNEMAVAAVWWGAAAPLVSALRDAATASSADQLAHAYAGEADAADWAARAVLAEAAEAVDAGVCTGNAQAVASRVRAVVAHSVERILQLSDRALGPEPLAFDEAHARRVSDLRIYLRQHHAERDLERLSREAAG